MPVKQQFVSNMVNGIVKWFNSRKGYGFITPEGTPEGAENADIFVHHTNIKMEGFRVLYQGDKVTFDVEDGQKGKEARNIEVTERAPRPKRRRGPRTDRESSDEGDLPMKSAAKKDEDEDDEDKPSHDDDEDKPSHDDDKDDDDKDKDDDDN
ncbi:MAG TPA: cold shock domain-containing protein [Candidatus Lokiarchaeia archaeon]|nr:cold shock domain-containing protein [Candidatus Lokiarchaeia archaeon]